MTKLFAYFALFCIIGSAFADVGDDCASNYLTEAFDITVSSSGEVDGANLAYCKSLKEGTSCCAATEVAKFQEKIEAVVEELEDAVIIRDTAINTLRSTTIPALLEDLATLQTNAALAATRVAADAAAETVTTPLTTAQATEIITSLTALSDITQDDLDDLKADFTAFQTARGECFVELLNLQAAAYCLACDPAATTTYGLAVDGTLAISADVCTRLTDACYDYIAASASQSAVLAVGTISEVIDDLNTALAALGDEEDADAYTTLSEAITANAENEPEDETLTENAAEPSVVPEGCTDEDCETYICSVLFSKGEINPYALVLGGDQVDTLGYTVARRLQAGDWDPASDEAGVTINWKNDPADVNSEDDVITLAGAGIIKSGFVCVIALLSLFFL